MPTAPNRVCVPSLNSAIHLCLPSFARTNFIVIFTGKVLERLMEKKSAYWAVHNDEDEVAYSSDKPKVRYEYKQAKCRLSQRTSSTDPTKSFTNIRSLSTPKRKGSISVVYTLRLKKRSLEGTLTLKVLKTNQLRLKTKTSWRSGDLFKITLITKSRR